MIRRADTPIALLSPAVASPNVGDHFIELAIRRLLRDDVVFRRFSIRKPLSAGDIDAINECECALLCGTNLYQHDWHSELTPRMLERIRVPVVPFGLGGSARELSDISVSRQTANMIRALHAHCQLGGVRDPHAAAVLDALGVRNYILTGCPVLYWAGADLPRIEPIKRRRLVLTARNWLMHHWPENVDHPVQIEFLRKVLSHFAGCDMVFAIHEEWDERLIEILNLPARIVFQNKSPEAFIRLYSDPRNVVLAMRLHAGMLAIANGVPAVFVAHDARTYSFCQMLDLEYVELFSQSATEECIRRLERIMDGEPRCFTRMRPRFHQLQSGMQRFLEANGLPARQTTRRDQVFAQAPS